MRVYLKRPPGGRTRPLETAPLSGSPPARAKREGLSEVPIDEFGDSLLRNRADQLSDALPILEDEQSGDAHDAETTREFGLIVHVDLEDLGSAIVFRGDLFDERRDRSARAAPFGPEVDQDRDFGLQDLRFKIRRGKREFWF